MAPDPATSTTAATLQPMRILVTGGAGYVGSVSVERSSRPATRSSRSTTSPPQRVGGPRRRGARRGHLRRSGVRGGPPRGSRDRRRPPLRGALARRRVDARAGAVLPRERRGRHRAARGDARCGRRAPRDLVDRGGLRRCPEVNPITEDAPLRPINTYGETKRTLEAAAGWYRDGLRPPRRVALRYFNVAGASASERRAPRPRDAPHPERPRRPSRAASRSPCSAPTTRRPTAPRSATTSTSSTSPRPTGWPSRRPRRTTRGRRACSPSTSAAASGFSVREVLRGGRAGDRSRSRSRTAMPRRGGRSAGARRVDRPGARGARLGAAPLDARGDDRLGLGRAPGRAGAPNAG